jgi:hypothetical protein
MGLPTTLGGISSFILAVIFIVGISASDIYPDESQALIHSQNDFQNALNQSVVETNSTTEVGFFGTLLGAVGLDGIYDFIRNFLSLLVSFIVMTVQGLFLFLGLATILPTEFYLFFALIASASIAAIVKLIFFAGD